MARLNFVQQLQIANQKGILISTSGTFRNSYHNNTNVYAHTSYKCPVNSCFE